jgi:hypothetical protein
MSGDWLGATPDGYDLRDFTTVWRKQQMLELYARESHAQLRRCRLSNAGLFKLGPFDQQDAIACACGEVSENTARGAGASDSDVIFGYAQCGSLTDTTMKRG